MLILVYSFNFIDRQIVGILAEPIKAELGLSDKQLGLMGGLAFALFYTGLGIPIGWLADRRSRTWIITISLALWSLFTALCGYAQNFWQLFLCRMGVGVGEAGGVAPSYSLIADYFPPEMRGRALSVYSFGIPVGSAAGILLGGWIASQVNWRSAFLYVGLAGLLLAPVFRLCVSEPPRGRFDPPVAGPVADTSFSDVFDALVAKPSFWLMSFGAGACSILNYGLLFWLPSFFTRTHGLNLVEASLFYGSLVLVGGIIGLWMGGWLGDRLGKASRGAYARTPAIALLIAIPVYAVAMLSNDLWFGYLFFLIPQALGLVWLGSIVAAIQQLVPSVMRTTAGAAFLFINNLVGLGIGTVLFGFVSDMLAPRFGDESLRYSLLSGLIFYLISATLLLLAARRLDRDWHR